MIPYATITGTRRNRAALRSHGWRLLVTPDCFDRGLLPELQEPYALDNGAWGCFQRGVPFNVPAFRRMLAALAARAEWVVLPDIVAGGLRSLTLSVSWLPQIAVPPLRLIAVQDGMTPADVRPHLGSTVGLFLGGTTEWKIATIRHWGALARRVGCYFHVARVNTARRIALCQDAGADSFDGTSATRFSVTVPQLTYAARQGHLFGGLDG